MLRTRSRTVDGGKVDWRRLATAALVGIAAGGGIGLFLGFIVGLSGDLSGIIAGAVCVVLIEVLYKRGRQQHRP
jgi:hypothetical protein